MADSDTCRDLHSLAGAGAGAGLCHDVTIHVATTGNDENDGSASHPLRTFAAAQAQARTYPASESVKVQFEEGVYTLNTTQLLTEDDSGASGSPRIYTAAPDAKVT